ACTDWMDTTAELDSAEIRETNFATTPIVEEVGAAAVMMTTPVVALPSFSLSYPGSCAAMELGTGTMTGIACINANVPTACAASNVELAVLPDTVLSSVDDLTDGTSGPKYIEKYGAPSFVGVWQRTPAPGPVPTATVTLDSGADGAVIYGDILTGTSFSKSGASQTTSGGIAVVFTNKVVGVTVSAPGIGSRHLYIGSDVKNRASYIAVLN
ncbi:MAG TPA: hypothetical protein VGC41_04650, partial [Kofleriaceae bacterium]